VAIGALFTEVVDVAARKLPVGPQELPVATPQQRDPSGPVVSELVTWLPAEGVAEAGMAAAAVYSAAGAVGPAILVRA
jgi:hypothetical protein